MCTKWNYVKHELCCLQMAGTLQPAISLLTQLWFKVQGCIAQHFCNTTHYCKLEKNICQRRANLTDCIVIFLEVSSSLFRVFLMIKISFIIFKFFNSLYDVCGIHQPIIYINYQQCNICRYFFKHSCWFL